MRSTPQSTVHTRGHRSPFQASSVLSHVVPTYLSKGRQPNNGPFTKRTRVRQGLLFCGVIFLIAELLILRASLFYYKIDTTTATNENHPIEPAPRRASDPYDGTFNGYPVYYRNVSAISTFTKPYTLLHCVGENYQTNNWQHRSCHFQFLCFNLTSRHYQVYERQGDRDMRMLESFTPLQDQSESYLWNSTMTVSLGGINLKWDEQMVSRLQWRPRILSQPPTDFYALPPQVVLIPYHSLAGWNPGHMVWDDFLPMFTLMDIFQLSTQKYEVLAIRQSLEGFWASCDAKLEDCQQMMNKFWPLLNNRTHPVSHRDVELRLHGGGAPKTDLVCAKNGLSGIGDLTDHGTKKLHGWHQEDYQTTHNHGRGRVFWKFRNFCLQNIGIASTSNPLQNSPYRIVISVQSSAAQARKLDFTEQQSHLHKSLMKDFDVTVEAVVLKDMSLKEQVRLVSGASIFISGCGGGAVTATFLPKGATVIIYYNEAGGQRANFRTGLPARLDWDLFNHLAYLHVHWFPTSTMSKHHDLNTLASVVRGTLQRLKLEYSR